MNKNVLCLIAVIMAILYGFAAQNSYALLPAADEAGESAVIKAAEEQKKEKALIARETKIEKEKTKERDALLVSQIKERMAAVAVPPPEDRNTAKNVNLAAIVFGTLVLIGFYLIRGRRYKNKK